MSDDLEQFHAQNLVRDSQYAVARQLLDLGEAVMQLRESSRLTRGQLGKLLGVKARDIEIVEQETPRAPAGLLETALSLLVQKTGKPKLSVGSEIANSLQTVYNLRPALVAA